MPTTAEVLLQGGNQVAQGIQAYKSNQIAQQRLAMEGRQTDVLYGRDGQPGTIERRTDLQERQVELAENTDQAQWDRSKGLKPTRMVLALNSFSNKVPQFKPLVQPLLDAEQSGEIKTRGDMRRALIQMRSMPRFEETRSQLREDAAKAAEKGDVKKAEQLMGLYEATSSSGYQNLLDDMMGKPQSLRGERFGKAFVDEQGNRIQASLTTGQEARIAAAPSMSSTEIGPDGRIRITHGPALSTRTQGKLEEGAVDTSEELARLDNIMEGYDQKFLTIGGKASASLLNFKEKAFGEKSLTAEQKAYIDDASTFAQDAVENINLYIKRITGAQMSEKEATRLKLAMPDVGSNWFAGDGPTKFKAKLENATEKAKMANARYNYYLNQGMQPEQVKSIIRSGKAVGLGSMEGIIDNRGAEIEAQILQDNPNLQPGGQVDGMVYQQLSKEFGGGL